MKVFELNSPELDLYVAKVEKIDAEIHERICYLFMRGIEAPWMGEKYSPSTDWSQGGPIIEKEKIRLYYIAQPKMDSQQWSASKLCQRPLRGTTPLIAAMRSFVASKFGDTSDE